LRFALLATVCSGAIHAESWIRVNRLGWISGAPQKATILSEQNLTGKPWTLLDGTGKPVATGAMPSSLAGNCPQNPMPYGAVLSFALADTGTYRLVVPNAEPASIRVTHDGFDFLARQSLRHLRLMRSGPEQFLFRHPSHLGDSASPLRFPTDDWSMGTWRRDPSRRAANLVGGWYDAGDQIKFTLTIAYTTYFLLRAWEANPDLQARWLSPSPLPDILDEAAFGLDYLAKTIVDDTTFVIEVGDGRDHSQGARLPENDKLDGIRPALAALSPAQMGSTAAALALGARVFRKQGHSTRARKWEKKARQLHRMATRPGARRQSAYWKDHVNDLYRDVDPFDNLALMGVELFRTTTDSAYLRDAIAWSDSTRRLPRSDWDEMGITCALLLAPHHRAATEIVKSTLRQARDWSRRNAGLWGYPEAPVWCPLQNWSAFGAEALVASGTVDEAASAEFAWDVLDYTLGRNPWGVSFFMSPDIPGCASNIFNPIYFLNRQFPTGAIAEGPGSGGLHRELSTWFHLEPNEPTARFNTDSIVFFDNSTDFQTMETVIGQQASFLYLLAVVTKASNGSARTDRHSPFEPKSDSAKSPDALDRICPATKISPPTRPRR